MKLRERIGWWLLGAAATVRDWCVALHNAFTNRGGE